MTFRLGDSLPKTVVQAWNKEREEIIQRADRQNRPLSKSEQNRLQFLFSEKVEKYLDAGRGDCWMKRPEIADLVERALKHFDGERYRLLAWCVMPNHVHVVVKPLTGHELSDIAHSWKSFTASEANKSLGRTGKFWQPEPYDHLIRDEEDLEHAIEYVLNNPAAAGLKDWKWVGHAPDLTAILDTPSGTGILPVKNLADQGQDGPATNDPLPTSDIGRIVYAFRQWRGEQPPSWWKPKEHGAWKYADIPGFCMATTTAEIEKHGFVLTPGRYVGAEELEDDGEPFAEKFPRLVAELEEQLVEGEHLTIAVRTALRGVVDD